MIHARKSDLTVDKITAFQDALLSVCRRVGAPFYELRVNRRDRDAIVAGAMAAIFKAAGSSHFDAIGVW